MSDAKSPPDLSIDEIVETIKRLIAEDDQSGAAPASGSPAQRPAADDDVLELTAAVNEDGSIRHLAPIGSKTAAAMQRPPAEDAPPEPDAAPPPAPSPGDAAGDGLVSEGVSLAAASAFARLVAAPGEPATVGGRPLEDIVREELRPLLQSWLETNLPQIVERLVEAEIARLAARSGPG